MVHSEQDILRSYLRRINEDQLTRSNALYEMVTELSSPRDKIWTPDSSESNPSFLPSNKTAVSPLPRAVPHTSLPEPSSDPLGLLLRTRTAPIDIVHIDEKDMADDYSSDDSTSKLK